MINLDLNDKKYYLEEKPSSNPISHSLPNLASPIKPFP